MTKYSLLVFLCLFAVRAFGQDAPKVELSAPFSAMNCYKSRVVQCTNGNTFLFNYKKNGCDFLLFDAERKMIKRGPLSGRLAGAGESNDSYVSKIFEADSTLVFLLNQTIGGKPTLFRILINTANGSTISEEKLAELSKPKSGSAWAQVFGGVSADIKVVHDPVSGSYAVVSYDGFTDDTAGRLRIDLYNAHHEQRWSHTYHKLPPDHKYMEYLDLLVKQDKVLLCTHEYTTRSYGAEESFLIMTEIGAAGKVSRQQKLDVDPGLKGAEVNLLYVPETQKIMMCMTKRDGNFKGDFERYTTSISAINETDFAVAYTKEVSLDLMDAYSRNNCSKRKDFGGSFQNWFMNEKGIINMTMAEVVTRTVSTKSAYSNLTAHTVTGTELGDLGMMQFDKEGNAVSGYVIVHEEVSLKKAGLRLMNRSEPEGAFFGDKPKFLYEDLTSGEFSGCDYIHTPEHDYVISNVHRKTMEETSSLCDGVYLISSVDRSPAALYTITNGVQKRTYLWGEPNDKELFQSNLMSSSHYSTKTRTYAVVMVNEKDKKLTSRLGWIHF